MKKKIGQVEVQEKNEIEKLYERKNGLTELAKILPAENDALYEKVVKDLGKTSAEFQNWWETKAQKYGWESIPGGHWEINFQTCEIFIVS